MFRTIRVIIAAAALCVAASPVAARPKIDLSQQPFAERMHVEIRMPQQEIIVEPKTTNPMWFGGGMIGFLIAAGVDNSAQKKGETAVAPFRDKLVDEDFRTVAREAIEQGLSREVFAPELDFSFHTTTSYEDRTAKTLADGKRILVVVPSYMFAGKFSALKVRLDVALVDRSLESGRMLEKILYTGSFDHGWVLPDWNAKAKRGARIEAWKRVDDDLMAKLLRVSFAGAVALMNADLAAGHPEPPRSAEKALYPAAYGLPKARVIAVDGTRRTFKVNPVVTGAVDVVP